MITGIDYSFSKPNLAGIKKSGFQFICRYLSYDSGKNISIEELKEALSLDLSVVLVWETYSKRALKGYLSGWYDGLQALSQSKALGIIGRPIYFAVDFDASPSQQVIIDRYLAGVSKAIGESSVGVYGSYWVVKRCAENKSAQWFWQTYAWSGGNIYPLAHIHQYQNGVRAWGGVYDLNKAKQKDYGQYPIKTPEIEGDEDMLAIIQFEKDGPRQWMVDFGAKTRWLIPGPFQKVWIQAVAKGYFGKPIPEVKGLQTGSLKDMFIEIGSPSDNRLVDSSIPLTITTADMNKIAEAVRKELGESLTTPEE